VSNYKYDYFCLLWKSEWPAVVTMTRTFDDGVALKYTVNSSSRVIHVLAVRRLNQTRWARVDFYVKMYDEPQPGWDCTPQLWSIIMNQPPPNFVYHPPTGGGGSPGWDNSGVQNSWRRYYCNKGSQYYCN
jgi:hypothetical protein